MLRTGWTVPAALLAVPSLLSAQAQERQAAQASRPSTGSQAPTLEELTAKVRAAYGGGDKHRPVEAFRAEIDVTKLDGDSVKVSLGVRFRQTELLRYEIQEGDQKKERGIDSDGEWAAIGTRVIDLQNDRRSETELELVKQHLAVCRQLARFVDAAELLRSLKSPSAPRAVAIDLVAPNELAVPCFVVQGLLKEFPLYHRVEKAQVDDVRVDLYFDAQKLRLRAVGAIPLGAKGKPAGSGEWITLNRLEDSKDYLLPKSIVVWEPGDKPTRLAKIEVKKILWNPPLVAADFKRPR
jgi:hypothetical protein